MVGIVEVLRKDISQPKTTTKSLFYLNYPQILADLGTRLDPTARLNITTSTYNSDLDAIAARHFHTTREAPISLTGRALPLLYRLISDLLSQPHSLAILLIDIDSRFDPTRLECAEDDLNYLHIYQPPNASVENPALLRKTLAEACEYIIYHESKQDQPSASRPLWGTVVIGGLGGGDINTSWRGWLRVENPHAKAFPFDMGAVKALEQRRLRQEIVEQGEWIATSAWGNFRFRP